jgi:hypothetical protein
MDVIAQMDGNAGGPLRFEGELEEVPVQLAWQSDGAGGRYAMLSPALLKEAGLAPGQHARLRFRLVSDEDFLFPDELVEALALSPAAQARWDALAPGRRRSLSAPISALRRPESRKARAALLIERLQSGADLPGPPRRRGTGNGATCRKGPGSSLP